MMIKADTLMHIGKMLITQLTVHAHPAGLTALVFMLTACAPGETNVALGTLERDRIVLTATDSEIITAQPVAEGSPVETGQLLVQLDSRQQALRVQTLEAELAERDAVLEWLRNGPRVEEIAAAEARVDTAKAVVRENRLQLTRIQELVEKRVASQSELDSAQALVDSNAARLRDAEAQLKLVLAGTRPEELAQAEAQRQAARAQLALERRKLDDLAIVATRDGTLDSLPFHVGERVLTGASVAVILSDDLPYARVYIPASDRAAIKPGTTLTVHVDGYPESYTGRVRWIAQEAAFTPYYALNSSERSRLVYLAEVQLPAEAGSIPAGLPVQVELPR